MRYADRLHAPPEWWIFLRGEPWQVGPVLAAYGDWTRRRPDGKIDHPARAYLIDPAGYIRESYALARLDQRRALRDIEALLRARP